MPYKDPERQKQAQRDHYIANREKYLRAACESGQRRRQRIRKIIRAAKDKPCTDCGIKYPYYVMQFDHLATFEKVIELNKVASMGWSPVEIAEEIAKCEVVCANCHAERSHQRRQVVKPDDLVPGGGFEPPTYGLWARHATELRHPGSL